MNQTPSFVPRSRFVRWLESRLPIVSLMHDSFVVFPTPRNLNYLWTFGGILTICLVLQIVTGIVLAMHYTPHVDLAFSSIRETIQRDVNYGWLFQSLHANGASMFFIAAYIHMARGMFYGSHKAPREILWIIGVIIFFLMVITAFFGYSLVWGQMSFAGATVITSLFTAIPWVGETVFNWIAGGYSIGNPTLNRFFALHYLMPFVIAGCVGLHVWALHVPGNNNPTGLDVTSRRDTLPFHPFYTVKDLFAVLIFLLVCFWFVFFNPDFLGHPINYEEANPMVTPEHIVPEWYFLPFYAILRAIPHKLTGVIAMVASIFVLVLLPWLDRSRVRSARYRPIHSGFMWLFFLAVFGLGWLGSKPPEGIYVSATRVLTFYYFAYFLIILPIVSLLERPRSLPRSIADSVPDAGSSGRKTSAGLIILLAGTLAISSHTTVLAASDAERAGQKSWSFFGPFGTFDPAQLKRGFQIYQEVCASCHGLKRVKFRSLTDKEGPAFSVDEIKALASGFEFPNGFDEDGEIRMRPGVLADHLPSPFRSDEEAAFSNNGVVPPDLSLIAKARTVVRPFPFGFTDAVTTRTEVLGADYISALLTGYQDPPVGTELTDGQYYNRYFFGGILVMPPLLEDELIEYTDGTAPTVENYANDVSAFLAWAADPKLVERKRTGFKAIVFLLLLTVLLWLTKRTVWRDTKSPH